MQWIAVSDGTFASSIYLSPLLALCVFAIWYSQGPRGYVAVLPRDVACSVNYAVRWMLYTRYSVLHRLLLPRQCFTPHCESSCLPRSNWAFLIPQLLGTYTIDVKYDIARWNIWHRNCRWDREWQLRGGPQNSRLKERCTSSGVLRPHVWQVETLH